MISPETLTQADFYHFIDVEPNQNGVDVIKSLSKLPPTLFSLYGLKRQYGEYYNLAPTHIKPYLPMGSPLLISLWAYTEFSGRGMEQLYEEGVLYPGLVLYNTDTHQDDILDLGRKDDKELSAKQAFWFTKPFKDTSVPTDMFRSAIAMINRNKGLYPESRSYMLRSIGSAYRNYVKSEDQLAQMANEPQPDL